MSFNGQDRALSMRRSGFDSLYSRQNIILRIILRCAKKKTPGLGDLTGQASYVVDCRPLCDWQRRPALGPILRMLTKSVNTDAPSHKVTILVMPPVLRKDLGESPSRTKSSMVLLHCGELTHCECGSEPPLIAAATRDRVGRSYRSGVRALRYGAARLQGHEAPGTCCISHRKAQLPLSAYLPGGGWGSGSGELPNEIKA